MTYFKDESQKHLKILANFIKRAHDSQQYGSMKYFDSHILGVASNAFILYPQSKIRVVSLCNVHHHRTAFVLVAIALLHDYLEDCVVTSEYQEMFDTVFTTGEQVIVKGALELLTKTVNETSDSNLTRILQCPDEDVMMVAAFVKYCDACYNSFSKNIQNAKTNKYHDISRALARHVLRC